MSRESEGLERVGRVTLLELEVGWTREGLRPATGLLAHDALPGWVFEVSALADGTVTKLIVFESLGSGMGRLSDDVPGSAPDAGVTTRLLRRIPMGELGGALRTFSARKLARFAESRKRWDEPARELWNETFGDAGAKAFADTPRPGRRGRPDAFYAGVARDYVSLLAESKPVEMLARRMSLSASQVRSILYEARRRKLLTAAPRGVAGGNLTENAIELLKEEDADGTR